MDLISISNENYNRLSYISDNIDSLDKHSYQFKKDLKSRSNEIKTYKEYLKFYSKRYVFYEAMLQLEKRCKYCKNSDYILRNGLQIWYPLTISFKLMKKEQKFEASLGNTILYIRI